MRSSDIKTSAFRGFTLVELLVVIAIIALLLGLLIVAIGRARGAAFNTVDQANLRAIATASNTYASSNRGNLPSPRTDTPGRWGSLTKDPTKAFDANSNSRLDQGTPTIPTKYMPWVLVTTAGADADTVDTALNIETLVALEKGSMWNYLGNEKFYRSPMDPSIRLRSYSLNAFVGVLYADDYDGLPGGTQGSSAWISSNYGYDTRTLSRIKQPSGTFFAVPEWDKYKAKTTVDGWNEGGYLSNPAPEKGTLWFDAPAIWSAPQYQINLSYCDGSMGAYQILSQSLRDGKVVTDPINGYADSAGESKPDLVGLKNITLPGLIP